MAEWFSCNGCSGSDPTSDTVKVNASLLAAAGKENVQPTPVPEKAHEVQKAWEQQDKRAREQRTAEERRQVEEQAKRRREEEDANRFREEAVAAERDAVEERMKRAAAEAGARAKEEQLRLEVERVAEEVARAEREAEEKAAKEKEHQAGEKVTAWCKKKGFPNMNTKMSSFFKGSKFPLHAAVADKDAEMVGLMVLLGVDKAAENYKGQTAEDLATKLNKNGSMDAILASLK